MNEIGGKEEKNGRKMGRRKEEKKEGEKKEREERKEKKIGKGEKERNLLADQYSLTIVTWIL